MLRSEKHPHSLPKTIEIQGKTYPNLPFFRDKNPSKLG